jgi:hypothetical protein
MRKVDNTFRVFNAGRLSNEGIQFNVSTLSFENIVMNDGRILICSQHLTEIFSRCTIDWMTSGNIPNLSRLQMWNDFKFTNFDTHFNSWSHSYTSSQVSPDIWSSVRAVNLQISTANAWPYNFQLCLPHNPLLAPPARLRY